MIKLETTTERYYFIILIGQFLYLIDTNPYLTSRMNYFGQTICETLQLTH